MCLHRRYTLQVSHYYTVRLAHEGTTGHLGHQTMPPSLGLRFGRDTRHLHRTMLSARCYPLIYIFRSKAEQQISSLRVYLVNSVGFGEACQPPTRQNQTRADTTTTYIGYFTADVPRISALYFHTTLRMQLQPVFDRSSLAALDPGSGR